MPKKFKITCTYTIVMSALVNAESVSEVNKIYFSSASSPESEQLDADLDLKIPQDARDNADKFSDEYEITEIPTCDKCDCDLNKHGECMEKWYCPNFGGEMPMSMRLRTDGTTAAVYDVDDDQQLDSDPNDTDFDDGGWEAMNRSIHEEPSQPEYPSWEPDNSWDSAV